MSALEDVHSKLMSPVPPCLEKRSNSKSGRALGFRGKTLLPRRLTGLGQRSENATFISIAALKLDEATKVSCRELAHIRMIQDSQGVLRDLWSIKVLPVASVSCSREVHA